MKSGDCIRGQMEGQAHPRPRFGVSVMWQTRTAQVAAVCCTELLLRSTMRHPPQSATARTPQ